MATAARIYRPYRRIAPKAGETFLTSLRVGQLVYDPASEMVGVLHYLDSTNIVDLKRPWGNTVKADKRRLREPTEHQRKQYASLLKLARDRNRRSA